MRIVISSINLSSDWRSRNTGYCTDSPSCNKHLRLSDDMHRRPYEISNVFWIQCTEFGRSRCRTGRLALISRYVSESIESAGTSLRRHTRAHEGPGQTIDCQSLAD